MRGALGPILTTGVALAAAGVVVANPIVAPRSDVKIPAVQLSAGTGEDMLNPSFLNAIAPAAPESTNPFSVLRQLISSLAADATYIGKNAIVDAFVAGVTAVTGPGLTATSTPIDPLLIKSPEVAASLLPGLDLSALGPIAEFSPNPPVVSTPATSGTVAPVVQTLVSNVINDAGFVGGQLVTAAFAAGAVVAAEPALIGDTLKALISGDLAAALQTAVNVVATATLGPSVIILNALRVIVDKGLDDFTAALTGVIPALNATTVTESEVPSPTVTPPTPPAPALPLAHATRSGRVATAVRGETRAKPEVIPTTPQPAAAVTAAATRAVGFEPAPATESSVPGRSLRDAVETVGKQIGTAVAAATVGAAESVQKRGVRARAGRATAN